MRWPLLDEATRRVGDRVRCCAWPGRATGRLRQGDEVRPNLVLLERDCSRFDQEGQGRLLSALAFAHDQAGSRASGSRPPRGWPNRIRTISTYGSVCSTCCCGPATKTRWRRRSWASGASKGRVATSGPAAPRDCESWRPVEGTRTSSKSAAKACRPSLHRPGCAGPPALAEIAELRSDREQAILQYLRAIELGERSPSIIRRAVELLYATRRFDQAAKVLRKLDLDHPPTAEVRRLTPRRACTESPASALALAALSARPSRVEGLPRLPLARPSTRSLGAESRGRASIAACR